MSEEEHKVDEKETPQETDLGQELARLGRRLSAAAQAVWETEEARRLRREVKDGLETLSHELEEGLETVQTHPTTKKVQEEVGEVLESARTSKAAQEVKEGFLGAVRELNKEIDKFVQDLKESAQPEEDKAEEVEVEESVDPKGLEDL